MTTKIEDEDRQQIYNGLKVNYVFNLSKEYSVDAFRLGNESRYINHSESPNCYAKVLTVNCDKRIAFFAKRNINADEGKNRLMHLN